MTRSGKAVGRDLLQALGPNSVLARFIESPTFWPLAVKGGAENTLRDLLLYDLNAVAGRSRVYTGERSRFDIVACDRPALEALKPGHSPLPEPRAAIELKFNHASQATELDRARQKLEQMEVNEESGIAVAAVHFLCEVWQADRASAVLLARYGAHRALAASARVLEQHLSRLPRTPLGSKHFVPWVLNYQLRCDATPASVGRLAAVVWWPSKHSSMLDGLTAPTTGPACPQQGCREPRGLKT